MISWTPPIPLLPIFSANNHHYTAWTIPHPPPTLCPSFQVGGGISYPQWALPCLLLKQHHVHHQPFIPHFKQGGISCPQWVLPCSEQVTRVFSAHYEPLLTQNKQQEGFVPTINPPTLIPSNERILCPLLILCLLKQVVRGCCTPPPTLLECCHHLLLTSHTSRMPPPHYLISIFII